MYERMSVNQYAAYEKENGTALYRAGTVWWQEIRPFFFAPSILFKNSDWMQRGFPGLEA